MFITPAIYPLGPVCLFVRPVLALCAEGPVLTLYMCRKSLGPLVPAAARVRVTWLCCFHSLPFMPTHVCNGAAFPPSLRSKTLESLVETRGQILIPSRSTFIVLLNKSLKNVSCANRWLRAQPKHWIWVLSVCSSGTSPGLINTVRCRHNIAITLAQ